MQVPYIGLKIIVPKSWIDVNKHMNVTHYGLAVYDAHFNFSQEIGLGEEYAKNNERGKAVLESHMIYENEISEGDELEIRSWLLAVDAKRLHFFHEIYNCTTGQRSATSEQVDIHIDLRERRSAPLPDNLIIQLKERVVANLEFPLPEKLGSTLRPPVNNWLADHT